MPQIQRWLRQKSVSAQNDGIAEMADMVRKDLLALGFKDVRLALAASEKKNVPLPFANVLRDAFLDASAVVHRGDRPLDRVRKVEAYRFTTRVDYACELAHQKLSNVAHELAREERARRAAGA